MRDKFSELIASGVASYNYTPLCGEIPEQDHICKFYNNVFGAASDTHMSCTNNKRYITGRLVGWETKWGEFYNMSQYAGVRFLDSGYWSLSDFLYKNGLETIMTTLNGDRVVEVRVRPIRREEEIQGCSDCCVACESNIKKPLSMLTTDRNEDTIKECFVGGIDDVVEKLNSNPKVKGNQWVASGNNIVGLVDGKVIMLEAKINSVVNFDLRNDIYNALAALGYEYDKKGKSFEEDEVEDALDWFMDKFFEENEDD